MAVTAALSPANLLKPKAGRIVAALDVGSSKVAAIIVSVDSDGPPQVLGAGLRRSTGLKRGLVADMARTEQAIRAAMSQAERASGIEVESVLVNLSAGGLESRVSAVEIDIAGHRIADADMERLLAAGSEQVRADLAQTGLTTLHAEPALYTVDGLEGVNDPRGFHANQVGMDIHVITAQTPPCRNLDLAVRNAHLGVDRIIASGVAASHAVLNEEERDLGVALVEVGAGVTTIAVHAGGVLVALATVPMGGADITADIAASFGTRRDAAERLKTLSGAAQATPRDNHDMVDIPPLDEEDGTEPRRVPRGELIAIIRARLDLLFGEVADALAGIGFKGPAGRQVVLTGGTADLRGIADFAAGALSRTVRIGRPRGLIGLPDAQSGVAFATLAGLVLHASRPHIDLARVPSSPRRPGTGEPTGRSMVERLFATLKRQF
jgi:cell division protein FtsA